MKNSLGFILLLTCLFLSACSAIGASDDGVKKIKIGHGASESYHLHRAWERFGEELEKNGEFDVEIYPSSQFGNDAEMIENVQTGDLTIVSPPSSFLTNESPGMSFIELPYVFPSRESALNTLQGDWGTKQLDELEDNGLHALGYLENGLRHITTSNQPVKKPEDLNGLKLRTMEVPAHVYFWNDMGASAEGAPFAELYNNLSSGRFDGQENPIAHIYSQKFYEVQNYITLTGHVYTAYVPIMNLDFWNELSQKEQQAINEAFESAYKYQLDLIEKEESIQLEEIRNNKRFSTEIVELNDSQKKEFIDAAKPTLKHYRKKLGAKPFDAFIESVNKNIH